MTADFLVERLRDQYGICRSCKILCFFSFYYSCVLLILTYICLEINKINHRTPLVRWSLHKYKCLWGVGGKGQGSSLQEGVSHTYTLRLG